MNPLTVERKTEIRERLSTQQKRLRELATQIAGPVRPVDVVVQLQELVRVLDMVIAHLPTETAHAAAVKEELTGSRR